MSAAMSTANDLKDAATILLVRGAADFDLFMLRRGKTAQFMARAMVFPGGRVDAADHALLDACDLAPEAAAAQLGLADPARALAFYVAAIRETFEEAGVLLASGPDLDPERLEGHRAALNAKAMGFAEVVEAERLTLHASALRPYAHWITPPIEKRRYDTRFFIAQVPPGQAASHDDVENTAGAWLSPRGALDGYADGTLSLAPPTLWELTALSACADADAACALRSGIPAPFAPQPAMIDGALHLLLPGDAGFDPPGPGRARVVLRGGAWVVEAG